ncbi:putative polyketide synthase [Aspergillus nomiae NRRL 13137]|uniref:Putative polyketide synthase n=1 Tax=Aspergillus nomiae NRRL (strain ATCC 15546 / NRRL 13137 / CBS 260.88 / M93) TaxID=1509407 RepID=A0A0L1INL0_ASPN3|nr:putative polyketide synthase [Aspergillus nomiae NRRL 13137]KNG81092.1 putative polyketide synthase [Aspergillus nomiae NRRL 13137]
MNINGFHPTNGTHINGVTGPGMAEGIPIAICGISLRLPGGIRNDRDLYNFLLNKKDARTTVPKDRFNINSFYHPSGKPGTIITKHGYFLEDIDLSKCDATMFNMTPAEIERLDPHQRILLEVVREALEGAGEADFKGKDIGTYVGNFTDDWLDLFAKDVIDFAPYQLHGKMDFALANRVAYEYDLRGPSMTIKTACSSSALAIHEAAHSIRSGECSAAIVSGSNLNLVPGLWVGMSAQMTLAPDGSSKTFDASANGYARADGIAALYIKRLDFALRDGNPVRAVIRSSASNADGRTPGMTMPSSDAQEALIRQCYDAAGLDLSETAWLNATAVLSLENKTIIPNIKFNTPNPAIPWETAKLVVPTEPLPWPAGRCERISVNSFGIGGSNVHLVLDSAASFGLTAGKRSTDDHPQRWHLLAVSANHQEALTKLTRRYEVYLQSHSDRLRDLAYTILDRREHLKLRSFCVTDGQSPLEFAQSTRVQSPRQVAFVFTGQGAQWVHMGRELLREFPQFLQSIRSMDNALQTIEHTPSWSIEGILMRSEDKSAIRKAELSQPLCTALQVALIDLLATWGVKPCAVVGHSSGEIAAAYAAGAISRKEAIITAFYRGFVCRNLKVVGGMAAIGLGQKEVAPYLVPGVSIACENSTSSTTLSGDLDVLESVMGAIKKDHPNILVRQLEVEMAYHSRHMQHLGNHYCDLISSHLSPKPPRIPFFSSVHAKILLDAEAFGPRYWKDNLESPVLFYTAIMNMMNEFDRDIVHLEIGPHSALSGPLRQTYRERASSIPYFSALIRGENDTTSFLSCLGHLYCAGVPLYFPADDSVKVLPDLPNYPWHYEASYWAESRVMNNWRFREHLPHDLLGLRTLESSDFYPTWRNNLRVGDISWLRDHRVGNDIVFPAAAYLTMAGEAIFQLTGSRDYTLREVDFNTAMVLYESKATEVMTTLRKKRLTSASDSKWYEFSIASHDGSTWNKHCSGYIVNGCAALAPVPSIEKYARKVSSSRWYQTMAKVGLNYGPRFTGLYDITASPSEKKATMTVTDQPLEGESLYALHPTTLDLILQSWTVASVRGEYRLFNKLFLPRFIEEFYVSPAPHQQIDLHTVAIGPAAIARGESYGVVKGHLAYFLRGFKGTPLDQSGMQEPIDQTALTLHWRPEFTFADTAQLMRPSGDSTPQLQMLERLFVLCAIETQRRLVGIHASQPHFDKYRAWIDRRIHDFLQPDYPLVSDAADLVRLDSTQRRGAITNILKASKSTTAWPVAEAIWRAHDRVVDVFESRIEYIDLLFHDGLMPKFYDWSNSLSDIGDLFDLLAHTKPQLRVLEIGAGTGGSTSRILQRLISNFNERLYVKYTISDVSSGFFVQCKERFKQYEALEYKVLDISRDPLAQGFTPGEYDLIVASNVLHATPNLIQTLENCRTLLRPDGHLFLQELSPVQNFMGYIMGLFAGWWLGDNDGRESSPLVPPSIWDVRLSEAGFDGIQSVSFDNKLPYYMNANLLAVPAVKRDYPKRTTLLISAKGAPSPLAQAVEASLRESGTETDYRAWGEDVPVDQDLISFIDVDLSQPVLQTITEQALQGFLQIIDNTSQATFLWLTPPSQMSCRNPHAAQILGMARNIRPELAMDFATVELADRHPKTAQGVINILRKVQRARMDPSELDPDLEYSLLDGQIYVGRFHWYAITNALAETAQVPDAKSLAIHQRGMLQTLHWTGIQFDSLDPDQVEVEMRAVGMNFHDLMIVMNMFDSPLELGQGFNSVGMEGTGYVTRVGENVINVNPGDRVVVIGSNSTGFATKVHRPAEYCVPCPEGLRDEEAAGMPFAYMTVLWSFIDKGQLQRGQSVLIHSAAGGVGIAAIHVARWLGLEIYVTVGNDDKVNFLMNKFQIPRNRIFDSHSESFLHDIMTATNGVGVDAVLNSSSGELLHASWKCVAANGCMLEIGKRDLINRGLLDLSLFEENRSYFGVDFSRLTVVNKPAVVRLLKQTMSLYEQGHIKPIDPTTVFSADKAEDAFRFMQKGLHMGRIVIKFQGEDDLPLEPTPPAPSFKQDRSYLLVGGMGGLGQSVARWMVSAGAQHLIFLSRSAGKSRGDQEFVRELNEAGCEVQVQAGDVTDLEVVRRVICEATHPVAGVLQMAMVLRDVGVGNMDEESWKAATRPKIEGTWNLHQCLLGDVDFFVLFGSNSGTIGSYGQANYAAANAFLDAFVRFRHNLNYPASVIDIGAVGEVGYVSRMPKTAETMTSMAGRLATEQEFLDCLQLCIARSATELSTGTCENRGQIVLFNQSILPIEDPQNSVFWKRDPRLAIYRNIQKTTTEGDSAESGHLRRFLASVVSDPSQLELPQTSTFLAKEIAQQVSIFLMRAEDEIEISRTLTEVGVDSLVAIEVRNWWKQNLGVEVSVLELRDGGNIHRLGELAAQRLKEKYIRAT